MLETFVVCLFVIVTGACIGSFLNVVALRAISGESIVLPASKCPLCNEPIKWFDNIPVLSYFLTFKGKCRNCGGKVSVQYPIVEALSAAMFLAVFLAFGCSVKSVLILILLCISIVITITDIKKGYVYEKHSWILIITAIVTSLWIHGLNNYSFCAVGLLAGVFLMEALARLSYYLVKKDIPSEEQQDDDSQKENQNIEETEVEAIEKKDINEYIKKNKRAFGEGDTYLAAAAGALLGWKYLFAAVAFAIILQAVCILPQFIKSLYDKKEYRLLISLSLFIILAIVYWLLTNLFNLNLYIIFAFIIALIFFAIDTIMRLKKSVNEKGFVAIPFGPAFLCSMFLILFFGKYIISFIKSIILV